MKNLAIWRNSTGAALALLLCVTAYAQEASGSADTAAAAAPAASAPAAADTAPATTATAPAAAPAAPVAVPAASALPEIQRKNGIEYITGGIGIDESRAMQFEAEHWPLLITMAEITRGQSRAVWVANVDVSISTRQDKPIIDFRSNGPLALVRLEAGKYTIRARFNGVEEKRDFMVMAGMSQKLTVLWKTEPR